MIRCYFSSFRLYLYSVFIFCFFPKFFAKDDLFCFIYVIGLILSFLLVGTLYFSLKKLSSLFIVLVLFRLSFFYQTYCSNGDIFMWGYISIVLLTLCFVFEVFFPTNPVEFISVLVNVLLFLSLINLASILFDFYVPSDGGNIYFMGIRTRVTDFLLPLCIFSFIENILRKRIFSLKLLLCLLVSVITITYLYVSTAIVGFIVFFVSFVLYHNRFFYKISNILFLTIIGLTINYLVINTDFLKFWGWFIEDILGKHISLSDRTYIWKEAISIISDSFFVGQGLQDNGNFVNMGNFLLQSHNNFLQLFADGGVVTFFLFLCFFFICKRKSDNVVFHKIYIVLLSSLFSFFIMMITEIFVYTPFYFLLIFFWDNFNKCLSTNRIFPILSDR